MAARRFLKKTFAEDLRRIDTSTVPPGPRPAFPTASRPRSTTGSSSRSTHAKQGDSLKKVKRGPFDLSLLRRAAEIADQYQIILHFEDGTYYGRGLELPGVMNDGQTPDACVKATREILTSTVAYMLETGQVPPAPLGRVSETSRSTSASPPKRSCCSRARPRTRAFAAFPTSSAMRASPAHAEFLPRTRPCTKANTTPPANRPTARNRPRRRPNTSASSIPGYGNPPAPPPPQAYPPGGWPQPQYWSPVQPQQLRPSGMGLASLLLSVISGLTIISLVVVAGVMANRNGGDIDENSAGAMAASLGIMVGVLMNIVGLVLGIVALLQRDRKKTLAIVGVTVNGLLMLIVVGLVVIGIASS